MTLEQTSRLVYRFEDHTLPKGQWTHTAHCIVALWYCVYFPLPEAVEKIRIGIRAYNVSIGGINTDTAGYHETITLFYMATISHYLITNNITELSDEVVGLFLQQPFLAREYIHQFYPTDRLMSEEARRTWTPPDAGQTRTFPYQKRTVTDSRHT